MSLKDAICLFMATYLGLIMALGALEVLFLICAYLFAKAKDYKKGQREKTGIAFISNVSYGGVQEWPKTMQERERYPFCLL